MKSIEFLFRNKWILSAEYLASELYVEPENADEDTIHSISCEEDHVVVRYKSDTFGNKLDVYDVEEAICALVAWNKREVFPMNQEHEDQFKSCIKQLLDEI